MISKEHLDFIPKIYETIVSAEAWTDVLDEFAHHSGARGATLILSDCKYDLVSSRRLSSAFCPKTLLEYEKLHGEEEADALQALHLAPIRTWVKDYDAFGKPAAEIPGNRFLAKHFGIDSRSAIRLNDTPVWFDAMSINFKNGRGNITPEEDAISQIFLPHIARSIEISRPFILLQQRFNAVLSVLDRFKIGLAIVNAKGSIVVANREAEVAFFAENGLTQSREKKILLKGDEAQAQLTKAIADAHETNTSTVLCTPKRAEGTPWVLDVFPLTELQGGIDGAFRGAAVFITDPDRKDVVSTEGIAQLFGLTDAESAVCGHLAQGMKTSEIADHRNTTLETVKSQVKSLFSKTATTSQTDLVRLALKVNLPVDAAEN